MRISGVVSAILGASTALAKSYREGDKVSVSVKPLTFGGNSFDDSLYLYPVDYYHPTLDSCDPASQQDADDPEANVTYEDKFFSAHYKNAPFNTTFLNKDARCASLCDKAYNKANVTMINDLIRKNYKLNFFIEDVPVGHELYDFQTQKFYIDNSVPLGYIDLDKIPHLFNHFQFVVYYTSKGKEYDILYATVSTQSLTRVRVVPITCQLSPPLLLRYDDHAVNNNRITYDIVWKEVHAKVNDRWELYHNDIVRPFIARSMVLMFIVITAIIGGYTFYTIKNAITVEKAKVLNHNPMKSLNDANNQLENMSNDDLLIDSELEFSWMNLTNDVFRTPTLGVILYWVVSLGAHLFLTSFLVILHYATSTLNVHGIQNNIEYSVLSNFFLTSPVYAFLHAYLFKSFEIISKKKIIISLVLNSVLLPMILHPLIQYYNAIHASVESPINIPIHHFENSSMLYMLITSIVFIISLVFAKVPATKSSEIAKKVPDLPITFRILPNMFITGLFPFSVILIPLSTLYITLWYNHFYVDSLLTVSYIMMVLLIINISILNVYYSLSIGNWRWTWFSFLSGFAIFGYTFGYSIYLTNWKFGDEASMKIFFVQNFVVSSVVGLIGGSVGFLASLVFVRKLYGGMRQ